jgi:RNAse (barnase) inhibitor barstar
MSVKKYVVNGKSIQSLGDFYDEITKLLSLPEYFVPHLDAHADVITTDIEWPIEISWEFSSVSKKALKRDYSKIVSLLKRVAKEREDFKVIFQ